jgi:hypothetical protein
LKSGFQNTVHNKSIPANIIKKPIIPFTIKAKANNPIATNTNIISKNFFNDFILYYGSGEEIRIRTSKAKISSLHADLTSAASDRFLLMVSTPKD